MNRSNTPYAVLKACQSLQLQPDRLTRDIVVAAWKVVVTKVDSKRDEKNLVLANVAKDVLLRWLDDRDDQAGVLLNRKPPDDEGGIAMPLPDEKDVQ